MRKCKASCIVSKTIGEKCDDYYIEIYCTLHVACCMLRALGVVLPPLTSTGAYSASDPRVSRRGSLSSFTSECSLFAVSLLAFLRKAR